MFETINKFAGFNLSAVLFALFVCLISIPLFHYILWPILKMALTPVIGGWLKVFELFEKPMTNLFLRTIGLFKKKEKQVKNNDKSKTSKIEKFFEDLKNYLLNNINLFSLWMTKNFIIKTIFIIIIPFFVINYILESIEMSKSIFQINLETVYNTIWAILGATVVSVILSVILKILGMDFKKNVPVSFFAIFTIGIIRYFL